MNDNTDWQKIPQCQLAGVITEIIITSPPRPKFGIQKRILLKNMDVKNAFRQMGVVLDRTAAFTYRMEDLIFVDLRLHFGGRGSPGWWGLVASAIQEAHRATM